MTLRSVLTEQVLASSAWRRRQCGYPELEEKRAAWIDQFRQVFVGHTSISVPETRTKLVAYDDWPVTAGELSRAYLRLVFADVRRRAPSPHARGFGWQAPIVARPVRHRSLAYVDIVSAYWQLLSCFRPDDLLLGTEILPGDAAWLTIDEVAEDRPLRHAVVGSVFSNKLAFYSFGKLVVVGKTNQWSNPTLKIHCMQVLHAVAGSLDRAGALHAWLTDAAIVDADDAEPLQRLMARDWWLSSAVKSQGSGFVLSATTYRVGEKESLDITHGTTDPARAEPRAFSNLRRVPGRQLQAVRRRAAAA